MNELQRRAFIFFDEWLWISLSVFLLLRTCDVTASVIDWVALAVVVFVGAIFIYGIAYPEHWKRVQQERATLARLDGDMHRVTKLCERFADELRPNTDASHNPTTTSTRERRESSNRGP